MSCMSMRQCEALYRPRKGQGGLGYVQAIAAIVGPLAQGGASAYKTYAEGKQGRRELKQRAVEFTETAKLTREQMKAQQQSQVLAQMAALRQARMRGEIETKYAPYILGAVVVAGMALVGMAAFKGRRRG